MIEQQTFDSEFRQHLFLRVVCFVQQTYSVKGSFLDEFQLIQKGLDPFSNRGYSNNLEFNLLTNRLSCNFCFQTFVSLIGISQAVKTLKNQPLKQLGKRLSLSETKCSSRVSETITSGVLAGQRLIYDLQIKSCVLLIKTVILQDAIQETFDIFQILVCSPFSSFNCSSIICLKLHEKKKNNNNIDSGITLIELACPFKRLL